MTLVVDNIGLLVTNSGEHGDGVLGLRRDVALVIDTTGRGLRSAGWNQPT